MVMYPIPRNSLSQLQALGLYIHFCAFRNPCSTLVNNVNNPTYKLKKKITIESTVLFKCALVHPIDTGMKQLEMWNLQI